MSRPTATHLIRVLFVVAVVSMAVRAASLLTGPRQPLDVVSASLILVYLAWVASETPVTFRRSAGPSAESRTLVVYASSRTLLILAAVLPTPPWSRWSAWMLVPIGMLLGGMALRAAAIRELGRLYTHHVLRRQRHPVVTTGPYRLLRHPAYAGMLLANLGFVLFFRHPVSVLALVLLGAALVWRIRTEERVLWSVPGYPEFATGRARLLVGVW